ncbi:MAG: amidophosphoribosyltransferase [Spirochaetes bacterium]|nr:amidophosphoribosyltransferase [Spirochaetota bacterium]
MCGIVGFYGPPDKKAVYDIISGLLSLQHRGQDSVGVVTFDDKFHMKKGLGLVSNVFHNANLDAMPGAVGMGHVRYTTQGSNELMNVQPFTVNYPFGLSMVHNGNVINFKYLRKYLYEEHHRLLETSNDLELLLYTLASELEIRDLKNLSLDDIFESVIATQKKVRGAYATITVIANKGMLVFTDPYGIRPLVMGKKETPSGTCYGFASESTCFDYLDYEVVGDIGAGEIVFIDNNMQVHRRVGYRERSAHCIFCYIYFSREDSIMRGKLVADMRVKMGRMLANQIKMSGLEPDIVIDVPSSAYFFASGLSEELGIPYRRGFAKNNHIGRSFISPTQSEREKVVRNKLNPIREVVAGKKVAVVDDSIVRGTTSKHIVSLLRKAGAEKVYFVSAAPPIISPCIYGIDMATKGELIANAGDIDEINRMIGADATIYQSLNDMQQFCRSVSLPTCDACFSSEYPTGDAKEVFEQIEQERLSSRK